MPNPYRGQDGTRIADGSPKQPLPPVKRKEDAPPGTPLGTPGWRPTPSVTASGHVSDEDVAATAAAAAVAAQKKRGVMVSPMSGKQAEREADWLTGPDADKFGGVAGR